MRTFTPDLPASSLNKRRKSSSCGSDVVERRPKKGDEDYIKRPENAFILFRRQCCEDRQKAQDEAAALEGPAKKQRQADLSKTISQQWKSLSADERKYWENLAKAKKAEHEIAYPNYVYRPQRAKDRDGRPKSNKKGGKSMEVDESKLYASEGSSLQYVVPLPRNHGRSASAPTPPPYQSIQLPNVYMTPSCPSSPSLLPMISRRAAHPGHQENPMSSFDYLPSSTYLPPSYAMQGQFEASLQSSEFLRSMYNSTGQQRTGLSPLSQLTLPSSESLVLPAHQIVSPSSSIGSGSSGPSSPSTGPYTPTSSFLSQNYTHLAPDASLEAQAQAEMDLQMEMQMQQEFANFTWGGGASNGGNGLWSNEPSVLLGDDFDINAIPPLEIGMPKYTENMAMVAPNSSLEFGQEFTNSLEGQQYHDEGSNMGLLGFDEMMAGHNF